MPNVHSRGKLAELARAWSESGQRFAKLSVPSEAWSNIAANLSKKKNDGLGSRAWSSASLPKFRARPQARSVWLRRGRPLRYCYRPGPIGTPQNTRGDTAARRVRRLECRLLRGLRGKTSRPGRGSRLGKQDERAQSPCPPHSC